MRNRISYFLIIAVIFVFSLNVLLAQSSVKENKTLPGGFVKSTILKKNSSHSSSIYKDDMNGDNSIAGLESRGWVIVDADSGGDHPAWFQGDSANGFVAYEGPTNGYVASDFLGANLTTNILDHWLISPQITVSGNDTISFWMQSPSNSGFDDSISVYLSPDGGSNLTDFSLAYDDGSNTYRYLVPQGAWGNFRGPVPAAGNIRFAIRYHTGDANSYSWYIGIDLVEVLSSGIVITSPPTVTTGVATNIGTSSAILNGTINPNGASTAYTFEYGTTTSYGDTASGTQELTGSSDQNVNAPITGLTPNTLYHYRLSATNSGGSTDGNDATFTTTSSAPTVTTGTATNIGTSSATLNGTINPNGASTAYTFEYGTTTSYGNVSSGAQELTGSNDQDVNAAITGLTPNTLYHYRLNATNSGGTTNGSDATFTTTSSTSTVDLEWSTLVISTFNWIAGNSISAELKVVNNGNSTASPQSTQLYLSVDNSIEKSDTPLGNLMNFGSIPGGDSLTLTTSFTVPSVNAGIYFVGAFVDVNNVIAESNENNNNYVRAGKVIVDYPSNIQLSNTLTFNDPAQSSSYRMMGIPGNSNTPIAQIFSGTSGKDWTAFYDNGNTSDYLVSYTSTNTFNFTPGKGFWVLSKIPLNINQNANSVVLENDKVSIGTFELGFPIPLHSGWNIISNPFETSIVWSQVKSFNAVSEDIHSFNGSFTTSSNLDPYKGYYFFNVGNLSSLFIPYSPSSGIGKTSLKNNSLADNITISLLGEGNIKANISIGNNEESNIGYDKFDRFAPPTDFEDYSISILNNKLEIPYKNLLVDSRANLTNQNYDLQIKCPVHKNFELEMDAPENIENLNIYIFDQHSNFHNMKVEKHIILKSYSKVNNLQLLIGDNSFIEKQKSTLLPKEFKLSQNYPNPFNPTTVIQYSIPKTSEVELNIYDLLGNKVETLVNKEQTVGVYNYEFNASKLASGVYFYRIKAGNFVQTKKFVLMK